VVRRSGLGNAYGRTTASPEIVLGPKSGSRKRGSAERCFCSCCVLLEPRFSPGTGTYPITDYTCNWVGIVGFGVVLGRA